MKYSIQDLARYSGMKAHTIRAWEKRYNVLDPDRTDTNIRYYNDDQLRHLLNVVTLVRNGYRISEVSALSESEIMEQLEEIQSKRTQDGGAGQYEKHINTLIKAGLTYDEALFEKTFAHCILRYGLDDCYTQILHPVLTRTGLLWQKRDMDPCQEHFITNLVRQKLFTALDGIPKKSLVGRPWILFLPETEDHDVGLLFAHFLLRRYGRLTVFLGQRVPGPALETAVEHLNPGYLLTLITSQRDVGNVQENINTLSRAHRNRRIFISGVAELLGELTWPENCRWMKSPKELIDFLEQEDAHLSG